MSPVFTVGLPRECPLHGPLPADRQAGFLFPPGRMVCPACGRMSSLRTFTCTLDATVATEAQR